MRTYSPKPRDIERRWYVLDASGAVLGRLATEAAAILRGKHKPIFAPHMDTGDHVIVVNAKDVRLTGGKHETKVAYRHSGYPGGLTETRYGKLLAERPAFAVEKAIKGMLPHNRLGRQIASKLRVYADADHRHQAQQPQPLGLGEVPPWEGLPTPSVEPEHPNAPRGSKPAPKAPAAKRTTARRTTSKPSSGTTAKRSAAKSTAKRTSKSTAKRTTAKRSTTSKASATKKTAARARKKEA